MQIAINVQKDWRHSPLKNEKLTDLGMQCKVVGEACWGLMTDGSDFQESAVGRETHEQMHQIIEEIERDWELFRLVH